MTRSTIKGPQNGAITFNEDSADVDFRVESNGNANMLVVDAGNDKVGIGTNAPAEALEVKTTADADYGIKVTNDDTQAFVKVQSGGTALYGGNSGVNFVSGGSFATAMNIDASGHITKPLQSAFLARTSTPQTNVSNNTTVTFQFQTEIFDQNADYNTSTYTFTAPVTGRYMFGCMLRLDNVDEQASYYDVRLTTSNRSYQNLTGGENIESDGNVVYVFSALADMDASDTAKMTLYQSGGTAQTDLQNDSTFSGFLAC